MRTQYTTFFIGTIFVLTKKKHCLLEKIEKKFQK